MTALPSHVRILSNHSIHGLPGDQIICLKLANLIPEKQKKLKEILLRNKFSFKSLDSELFLTGLHSEYANLTVEMSAQQGLVFISNEIAEVLGNFENQTELVWKIKGRSLQLHERTHIMGILNITPDSFFDGGKYIQTAKAVEHALQMVEDGADIIDVGGESTRPGALPVSEQEEISRVIPVIESIRKQSGVPISIDTQKVKVAKLAIEAGAEILNDISGLGNDPEIAKLASDGAGLILMHIKGTPRDMQRNPSYDNLMEEILLFLNNSKNKAMEMGVNSDQIVLDPGIGFGKQWFDNYDLINRLQELQVLNAPILVGASRKSFLNKALSMDRGGELEGSLVSHVMAVKNGAHIVRVHDVKETKKAALVADLFLERKNLFSLEASTTQKIKL